MEYYIQYVLLIKRNDKATMKLNLEGLLEKETRQTRSCTI